jgi:hypothetical protein
MFDANHAFGSDFDCLDCGQQWPCPPYQELICSVLDDDMDAVTQFMSWFVPTAAAALPHLSERAVRRRVVGWCDTRRTPQRLTSPLALLSRPAANLSPTPGGPS